MRGDEPVGMHLNNCTDSGWIAANSDDSSRGNNPGTLMCEILVGVRGRGPRQRTPFAWYV